MIIMIRSMNSKEELNHCIKCNYSWKARIPNPLECPKCKNRKWKGEDEKATN